MRPWSWSVRVLWGRLTRQFSWKAGYMAGFHQAEKLARHDQVQR